MIHVLSAHVHLLRIIQKLVAAVLSYFDCWAKSVVIKTKLALLKLLRYNELMTIIETVKRDLFNSALLGLNCDNGKLHWHEEHVSL